MSFSVNINGREFSIPDEGVEDIVDSLAGGGYWAAEIQTVFEDYQNGAEDRAIRDAPLVELDRLGRSLSNSWSSSSWDEGLGAKVLAVGYVLFKLAEEWGDKCADVALEELHAARADLVGYRTRYDELDRDRRGDWLLRGYLEPLETVISALEG